MFKTADGAMGDGATANGGTCCVDCTQAMAVAIRSTESSIEEGFGLNLENFTKRANGTRRCVAPGFNLVNSLSGLSLELAGGGQSLGDFHLRPIPGFPQFLDLVSVKLHFPGSFRA